MMDYADEDENVIETPVEVVLKPSNASKQQKASLMNNLFTWTGSEKYFYIRDFKMSATLTDEQELYYWYKGYTNLMGGQTFAGEFLEYGHYQEPMIFVKTNPLDTELPTKRPLAAEFDAALTGEGSSKKTKRTGGDTGNDLSKCFIYENHPVFEYCDIDKTVKDMVAANKLYKKVIKYMMDVLKYAVQLNEKALWIYNRSDDDASNLFITIEDLRKEFSIKTNFENTIRINKFGVTKMYETKCKSLDEFIGYLYNEKRWLYNNQGIFKSEEDMIKALQIGIVQFDPSATRFLLNQTEITPSISFEEIVRKLKDSRKEYEFLGLTQQNPLNYSEGDNKNNFVNRNKFRGGYGRSSSNFRSNFRVRDSGNIGGNMWPFKVPPKDIAAMVGKKCYRCGVMGHSGHHHYNPAVGYNVGYNGTVGVNNTVGNAPRTVRYQDGAKGNKGTVGYGFRNQGATSSAGRGRPGPGGYRGKPFQSGNGYNRGWEFTTSEFSSNFI